MITVLLPLRVLWILWLCQESVISIICSNKSRYGRSSYVYEKATWKENWNNLETGSSSKLDCLQYSLLLELELNAKQGYGVQFSPGVDSFNTFKREELHSKL